MTSSLRLGSFTAKQLNKNAQNRDTDPSVKMPNCKPNIALQSTVPVDITDFPVSGKLQKTLDTATEELGDFSELLQQIPHLKATPISPSTPAPDAILKHHTLTGAFNDNVDSLSQVMTTYHNDTNQMKDIAQEAISALAEKEQEIARIKEQLDKKTDEKDALQNTFTNMFDKYKAAQKVITTGGKLLEQYSQVLNPALVSYVHHLIALERALQDNPKAAGGGQMIARAVLDSSGSLSTVELKSKALAGDKSTFHELMVPSNLDAITKIKEALAPLPEVTEAFQKAEKTFEDMTKPSKATESK